MKGKIIIETKLSEQTLMESALNMKASGINPILILMLFALKKRWHIDKVTYYSNLLEEIK